MATRLDAAASAAATTLAYTVGAASNRALIVGVQVEGTQSGNMTCDYGGQTMSFLIQETAGSAATQQGVALFWANDTQIAAASGNTITPGNTGTPGDITIHARSYQDCDQTTPTNVDSDTAEDATTPLANCDIITSGADAIAASLGGMGNAGTAVWASPMTEQTDLQDASSTGSFADDEVPSATTIACELTWTTPNRSAIVAVGIENAAAGGVSVTGVTPSEFDFDNANVDVDGSGFGASQGASDVYLSANQTVAEAGEVNINSAVNVWGDVQINLDFTQLSASELTDLHTLGPGARFIIVDDTSTEDFQAVTLHRPAAFQMVLGGIEPGGTTSRLTGITGTFGGGRAEETAAQNPSTTTVDVANNGNREEVWSMEAKPLSRENQQYDLRTLIGGVVVDTYTVTPQVTIGADVTPTVRPVIRMQAVKRGSSW